MKSRITRESLRAFQSHLRAEEMSPGTIENYLRHAHAFTAFAAGQPLTKELTAAWKEHLKEKGYAVATINAMLVSLNAFLRFLDRSDCRCKLLRSQRKLFRDQTRELTQKEYQRLVQTAREQEKECLALLLEAICGTGIRVSEVKFLTVENLNRGYAEIALKGKIRTILIPRKLSKKLLKYAKRRGITEGEVFLTRSGRSLSRRQIWAEMKGLCAAAKVEPSKVFPHNLRHLFAQTFYRSSRNIVQLADVLGHSSIETTRIYLITTGEEHQRQLEGLGLVS